MIHPTSDVQSQNIGDGTTIWQYVVVLPGAVIGNNCNINAHCFIENDVIIGDNVTIKCGVYIWDGITIEIMFKLVLMLHLQMINIQEQNNIQMNTRKHLLKKDASLGAGSVIL